jgi:acetaldehyde dehydrogenase/alcohol dehydrogenase
MPYFRSPKVLFGSGMLKRLVNELEGKGNKAVLITDKTVVKLSDQLVEAVKSAGFEVKVWDGAEPEPSTEVALAGSQVLAEFKPQLVIGFGGGSAIDTAKAAWILWERPDLASTELDKSIGPKTKLNLRQKARFLAVPTTSGTGSEVNWSIVLTDKANQRKMGFANNEIVPDIALLVPDFTAGMPKVLTASTGIDVLGHALDGYTARQQNDFSDGLCLQAMKLVFEWLPKAYQDGNDLVAREKMQNAAAIAGLGFGNSNTSLCHALAHAIGVTFNIGHGRTVGITLPYSLEYISSNPPLPNTPNPTDKLGTAAKFIGIDASSASEATQKLIQKIRQLEKDIGEPLSLKEAGINKEQLEEKIDTLVSLASRDVNILSSPCECKEENLRQIFQDMYGD